MRRAIHRRIIPHARVTYFSFWLVKVNNQYIIWLKLFRNFIIHFFLKNSCRWNTRIIIQNLYLHKFDIKVMLLNKETLYQKKFELNLIWLNLKKLELYLIKKPFLDRRRSRGSSTWVRFSPWCINTRYFEEVWLWWVSA